MKLLFLAGASAVSFAAFSSHEAAAQAGDNPIDHCRDTTETDKERIACLEAAVMGLMSAGKPVAEADEPDDDEEEARLAAAEAEAEPEPAGLGAEQVQRRMERETEEGRKKRKERIEAEAFEARLVDFARTGAGRLILVLDNGQVWAQRTGDRQQVRLDESDTPDVKVRHGAFSGYRMELSDPNVTIVVERLK